MMKEYTGIPLRREILVGLGACLEKKFFKSPSLKRQKMPLCVVENHVYSINFHSGMEYMTPPSNLCCTNFKKPNKNVIFKEETNARV